MISEAMSWAEAKGVRLVDGEEFWRFQLSTMPDYVASALEGRNEFRTPREAYMALGRVLVNCGEII